MKSRSGLKKITKSVRGKRGTFRRSYWTASRPKRVLASFNHMGADGRPTANSGSSHSLFALLVGRNKQLYGHNLGSHFDDVNPSYGHAVHRNFAEGVAKTTSDALKGTQHARRGQATFDILSGRRYDFDTGGTGGDVGKRWGAVFGARYGRHNVERK